MLNIIAFHVPKLLDGRMIQSGLPGAEDRVVPPLPLCLSELHGAADTPVVSMLSQFSPYLNDSTSGQTVDRVQKGNVKGIK